MKYAVVISEQAASDLRSIFAYIAYDLQSVPNATSQLSRLEKHIYALDRMPERYRRYDKEPWSSRNMRIMSVDNYCVFYIPNHDTQTVHIIRVIYGGRDLDVIMEQYAENT